MHPVDVKLFNRLLREIGEIEKTEAEFLAGGSAKDYADYRDRTGYIRALDDVRKLMQQISEDLDGEPAQNDRRAVKPRV